MTRYAVGQPVTQVEAPRLLTGKGRFADDIRLGRELHAAFLRAPHAHADIRRIDVIAARAMPGVLAVLTGADWAAQGLGDLRAMALGRRRDGRPMYLPPRPALAPDRVRHIGQSVAMAVAETAHQAQDAVEAMEVDYAPLPARLATFEANRPGTPAIWEDCPDNECCFAELGDAPAVDAALDRAAHVVRQTFTVNRVSVAALEPRAVVCQYDPGQAHFTFHASNQRPHAWRSVLAEHVFAMAESAFTLKAVDVGGSFGMKSGLHAEVALVAWASRLIGRPVRWTSQRSEAHLADDQARDMVLDAQLALDADGRFLAFRISGNNNVGAYVPLRGFVTPGGIAQATASVYATPALHGSCAAVFTNTVPVSNYRGPGRTPGAYVHERIVDMAARELGLDPAEIRRRNFISPDAMPVTMPTGITYDCGEFEAVMDKCLGIADYAGAPKRKGEARARGRLLGVGLSTTMDPSAVPSPETAELRFDPNGGATVLVGSTAGGQGHETIYTQMVSDRLGLTPKDIRVVEGDTEMLSWGTGTGASRTATIGGTALLGAMKKVVEKGRRIAAHLLEAALGDVAFEDGAYVLKGTDRSLEFGEVARAAFQPAKLPAGEEPGLYETATWSPEVANIPNFCHVCELEIDPETGGAEIVRYTAVHDVGVELNPALVRGQVHGGIAQGAGQALMEDMAFDPESGQLLTGSFLDYAIPRADHFPPFRVASHPVPTKTNPLGVKGAGECGTVGGLAAVMNALNDALAPLGIGDFPMPATPERVWRAIRDACA